MSVNTVHPLSHYNRYLDDLSIPNDLSCFDESFRYQWDQLMVITQYTRLEFSLLHGW